MEEEDTSWFLSGFPQWRPRCRADCGSRSQNLGEGTVWNPEPLSEITINFLPSEPSGPRQMSGRAPNHNKTPLSYRKSLLLHLGEIKS